MEHSQIFVDFEENKKKRSFKRKMVLGITPNTKFVYSLKPCCSHAPGFLFIYPYLNNQNFIQLLKTDLFQHYIMGSQNLLERPPTLFLVQYHLQLSLSPLVILLVPTWQAQLLPPHSRNPRHSSLESLRHNRLPRSWMLQDPVPHFP